MELAIGKYSGKKRLIAGLSSPHDDPAHVSVNELTDKDLCSMAYVRLDDASEAICRKEKGALMSKMDISDAFKIKSIKCAQWPYFCVKWTGLYYVFVRLVFGCCSSPRIFETLPQAI